jgi:hypothetical protein
MNIDFNINIPGRWLGAYGRRVGVRRILNFFGAHFHFYSGPVSGHRVSSIYRNGQVFFEFIYGFLVRRIRFGGREFNF